MGDATEERAAEGERLRRERLGRDLDVLDGWSMDAV